MHFIGYHSKARVAALTISSHARSNTFCTIHMLHLAMVNTIFPRIERLEPLCSLLPHQDTQHDACHANGPDDDAQGEDPPSAPGLWRWH